MLINSLFVRLYIKIAMNIMELRERTPKIEIFELQVKLITLPVLSPLKMVRETPGSDAVYMKHLDREKPGRNKIVKG